MRHNPTIKAAGVSPPRVFSVEKKWKKPNENANLYQLEKLRDAKGVYEKTNRTSRDASLPKIAKQADAVAQELIEAQKKQKK